MNKRSTACRMDTVFRRLAVGVVGLSMAIVGFILSITVPVFVAVLPRIQRQTQEDSVERVRRRIKPRTNNQLSDEDESCVTAPLAASSDTGSADSLESTNTMLSALSSSHHCTSTLPSSLSNSPEYPLIGLPSALPISYNKVLGRQHVCTPQKCLNHASTSASGSASAHQEVSERITKSSKEVQNDRQRSSRRPRGISWLKASPPPSLPHIQITPRSSGESSRPAISSPLSVETSDQNALEPDLPDHRRLRRASTLFLGLRRRASKPPLRTGSDPASVVMSLSPIAQEMPLMVEGRKSEPSSPSPALHDLHGEPSDAETAINDRKKRPSYFSRLKKRHSTHKDTAKAVQAVGETDGSLNPLTSSNNSLQHKDRGRLREKRSARRLCERHRRPATASAAPPPRTNPYEAPYFFPSPASPEAIDYVQRTRTEIQRISVSPSSVGRTPYRNEAESVHSTTPETEQVGKSAQPIMYTNSSFTQSAAVSLENSVISAPSRHRKSASASAAVDEFGFVYNTPGHVLQQESANNPTSASAPMQERRGINVSLKKRVSLS